MGKSNLIKCRDVHFSSLHPDPDQSQSALLLLSDVAGIEDACKLSQLCLGVTYDLRLITLQIIEDALIELGFHLDGSLLIRLKRALVYYIEETQRVNMGCQQDINSTLDVFVNRYQQLPHGCRDDRPQHWREYL